MLKRRGSKVLPPPPPESDPVTKIWQSFGAGPVQEATPRSRTIPSPSSPLARSNSAKSWQPRWAPTLKRNSPSLLEPEMAISSRLSISRANEVPPALSLNSSFFGKPFLSGALFSPTEGLGFSPGRWRKNSPSPKNKVPLTKASSEVVDDDDKTPMLSYLSTPVPKAASPATTISSTPTGRTGSSLTVPFANVHSVSSPALGGLIESFPSPAGRQKELPPLKPKQQQHKGTWDGGERWDLEEKKHAGPQLSPALPIKELPPKRGRNPPPAPAPSFALPLLPASKSVDNLLTDAGKPALRRLTLEGGPPSSSSYQPGRSTSRTRPFYGVASRSSTSLDVLGVGSTRNSPSPFGRCSESQDRDSQYMTVSSSSSSTTSLLQGTTASTTEYAKSLGIPRDAIKQILHSTQHVWRAHAAPGEGASPLKRTTSSPNLSSLSLETFETVSSAAVDDGADSKSRPVSMSTLPYIPSHRPSFEASRPSWNLTESQSRGASLNAHMERERFRKTYIAAAAKPGVPVVSSSPNFSRPIPRSPSDEQALSTKKGLQSPLRLFSELCSPSDDEMEEILVDTESMAGTPKTVNANWQRQAAPPRRLAPQSMDATRNNPDLRRRKSDSGLLASGLRRRMPGELHAWNVIVDDSGVPAIKSSPSAFHHPACHLAGKGNATWQCGCRGLDHGPGARASISGVPRFGDEALTNPRRLRSASVGDEQRQAALWMEVDRHRGLIRKHQEEIGQLHKTVERISTEIVSARPSLSSLMVTPEMANVTRFPSAPMQPSDEPQQPPPTPAKSAEAAAPGQPKVAPRQSLRRRFSSIHKSTFEQTPVIETSGTFPRLRTSSSKSSLNKLFHFPWSKRDKSGPKPQFPDPTPFPYQQPQPTKDRERSLPPLPPAQASRKCPPSSRKYSYDTLHNRDRSGTSKASSYGASLFDSSEDSRLSFSKALLKRWDSMSSRATSVSSKSHQLTSSVDKSVSHRGHLPTSSVSSRGRNSNSSVDSLVFQINADGNPDAPPRRSSLSKPQRDYSHLRGMDSISELSEMLTPTSRRKSIETSPGVRMSMSQKYVPNGIDMPQSLSTKLAPARNRLSVSMSNGALIV